MFPKPAFGAGTSGFGSFSTGATTAASPFGGFKSAATTSAFGAPPAFGASTSAQPAAGGGLFGTTNTTGGLFGASTSTAAPAFGNTGTGFGFGAGAGASGGLFANNTSGGLFGGNQGSTAFGAKPAGFGFGGTTTTGTAGSLFGSTPATGSTLFGQQPSALGGGGLFSNTAGAFGAQQAASGTAHVKYNPVVGTDVVVKGGASQNINIKHHCITCMKEYESKSLEELRLEDYTAGRKGSTNAGVFGGFQPQAEAKPLFGGSTFGQPAATQASSLFGANTMSTSGAFGQTNTYSFGNTAQPATNTTGLFGAPKPAFGAAPSTGTSLFGTTTTQAPSFGTTAPSFGFGSNTQNQSGGLFGAKPATTPFGAAPATTGFGAFGGGGLFGGKPAQAAAPAFGSAAPTPAFGNMSGGFSTAGSTSGGLFGANNTFGKPLTTQPSFGFNAPTTGLGTGLGGGLGASSFAKPAAPAFGSLGGGSLFQTSAQNTFATGLDSGLGGGMFGNNTALGGPGMGLGSNASFNLSGASAGGNVHEQILALVARPYGDSPLYKDIVPDSSSAADDVFKPTNPAAMKAVLDSSREYRVAPADVRLRVQPRPLAAPHNKKSLFDGLEENDPSLEDFKLSLRPSRKRLVLRPKPTPLDVDRDHPDKENETRRESLNGDDQPAARGPSYNDNRSSRDFDTSSNKYSSWLDASRATPGVEKEKPIDNEPTPRLYPNLDKELPIHISERRASWLTTKPLRKPLAPNPDSAENSVRELCARSERAERTERAGRAERSERSDSSLDKENIDSLSASDEEHVPPRDLPPHPTGVRLTRPGYYTIPSLDDMIKYMRPDGSCVLPHLTVGRKNYGNVYFDCEIDVAGLDLDALVHFMNKEVTIYPDDSAKPPLGAGLNRRAIVTLDRVWPRDKSERGPITDPERLAAMDYEGKLRRVCDKHDTKFVEYRPLTGSWVFRVEHFSKYGMSDSDEDDGAPEVLKRQIANQQLQKAAPVAAPKPPTTIPTGLGGLGGPTAFPTAGSTGLGGSSDLTHLGNLSAQGGNLSRLGSGLGEDSLFAMQQTSLNLLTGAGKAFEMDTTEDNLYQDNHRGYGVKSPTSELARLEHRQSHSVQLMKASLYAEADTEDDTSVSTGDQMVPRGAALLAAPPRSPSTRPLAEEPLLDEVSHVLVTEEVAMQPLIVRPQTFVLKYHRKVPPFKCTIAGRLGAAHFGDMALCRARHSRAGFGPAGALVYATSYDAVAHLPRKADLCELGKYTSGRGAADWSEAVVARLALGQADAAAGLQDIIAKQLETLLELSTFSECSAELAPRLRVLPAPRARRDALRRLARDSRAAAGRRATYGVSGAYYYEVFRLCEALWGADLDNDGVPGTDESSIVLRHKQLLEWMSSAVAETTDQELSTPHAGEDEDESDTHSAHVYTLLLGGRVLDACKEAREHGDLNMAALIAQGAGDPSFRSLVARQLSLWRECGALELQSARRVASLRLLAGQGAREQLREADWLRALHATARYLCPQVPSLEQVIRKYESFFTSESETEDAVDLSVVGESGTDEMGMQHPQPPYVRDYDVSVHNNGKQRRVLDLRYELIRARALNAPPRLSPAAYSPDHGDYSLCFILGAWLGCASAASVCGVAAQLEACGAWHLAVQALMYHPDDTARAHLIRAILCRHAPAKADTPELQTRLQLVRKLRVPEKWLLLAQAYRAKYEHLPLLEAEHLLGAAQWNAAHKVLMEDLFPEAVLADNLQSISPLLETLSEAAARHEVSGWDSGAQALHLYVDVCREIRGLVSSAETAAPDAQRRGAALARLEGLRPRVAAACRALGRLDARSPRHQAARAECGARLVQLALAAGEPSHHLVALLKALKLPPDYTHHAQQKIITDLAEQASELCIESATSSPLSSHHRAAVEAEQ